MAKELGGKDGPILVINSGSSSLKFGIYRLGATDEEPLLTGSAEGIGRGNGTLQIRSFDGTSLIQRNQIHESQDDALRALAAAIREHADTTPVAVGHRVVHGGPKLCRHQIITPQVLDQLRSARLDDLWNSSRRVRHQEVAGKCKGRPPGGRPRRRTPRATCVYPIMIANLRGTIMTGPV